MNKIHRAGFTLLELLVVVSIIAIIAAMAIPKLAGARLTANESNAIGTLRTIATAQAEMIASGSIDSDGDGAAEYAYFAEMAGIQPARVNAGGFPAAGAPGQDELKPSPLVSGMGNVVGGCVQRSGYLFQTWLPATPVGGLVGGLAEDPLGGKNAAPFPDSDGCEAMWCTYAWPLVGGKSGNLVYFINQSGQVLQMNNRGATRYSGLVGGPAFDAAFSTANDMNSELGINGTPANDGNIWVASK